MKAKATIFWKWLATKPPEMEFHRHQGKVRLESMEVREHKARIKNIYRSR